MEYKKNIYLFIIFFSFQLFPENTKAEQELVLDGTKSTIGFVSNMKILGVKSEVPGQFKIFQVLANKSSDLSKSKVKVEIDVGSIDTNNGARDKHLKKKDFFEVEKYPKIFFESHLVTINKKDSYTLSGLLSIKDKKMPIEVKVIVEEQNDGFKITGSKEFSRKEMGVDYDGPFFLPKVEDKVLVNFSIFLIKKNI